MTLAAGKGWIVPTRKQEIAMSSKPVTGIRLNKSSGKIVKTPPRMSVSKKIAQRKSKKVRVVRKTS